MAVGRLAMGSSRMKVAPWPVPALCTVSVPPRSLAASAPLCRPKPWPSLRVVNPWLNIRSRFSAGTPMPLSMIAIFTLWQLPVTRTVILLSRRPRFVARILGVAHEVDEDLQDSVLVGGDHGLCLEVADDLDVVAGERAAMDAQDVFDDVRHGDRLDDARRPAVGLLHGDDLLDVLDVFPQVLNFRDQLRPARRRVIPPARRDSREP